MRSLVNGKACIESKSLSWSSVMMKTKLGFMFDAVAVLTAWPANKAARVRVNRDFRSIVRNSYESAEFL